MDKEQVVVRGAPWALIITFIAAMLKLSGIALTNVSWWWVTALLWGPIAIIVAILLVVAIVALGGLIIAWLGDLSRRRRSPYRYS